MAGDAVRKRPHRGGGQPLVMADVARADAVFGAEAAAQRAGDEIEHIGTHCFGQAGGHEAGRVGPDHVEVQAAVADMTEIMDDQLGPAPRDGAFGGVSHRAGTDGPRGLERSFVTERARGPARDSNFGDKRESAFGVHAGGPDRHDRRGGRPGEGAADRGRIGEKRYVGERGGPRGLERSFERERAPGLARERSFEKNHQRGGDGGFSQHGWAGEKRGFSESGGGFSQRGGSSGQKGERGGSFSAHGSGGHKRASERSGGGGPRAGGTRHSSGGKRQR